jgi:hypothetical protein
MELHRNNQLFCNVLRAWNIKTAKVNSKRINMLGSPSVEIRKYSHRMICDKKPFVKDILGTILIDEKGTKTSIEPVKIISETKEEDGSILYEVEFLASKIIDFDT